MTRGFDQVPYLVSGVVFCVVFEYCTCLTDKMDGDLFYYCMLGECTYCTHVMWLLIECFKSTDNNLFTQRTCHVVGLCPRFLNIENLSSIPSLLIWFGSSFVVHY